jgi:hypothetical protein
MRTRGRVDGMPNHRVAVRFSDEPVARLARLGELAGAALA